MAEAGFFHLSASTIGRSTHAAGTAGAHLAYIARPGAAEAVIGERMPTDVAEARAWIDAAELRLRSNGRVLSKFMVALPAELTDPAARQALIHAFGEAASAGAAPWIAAVHQPSAEGDQRNFHAHLCVHDRCPATGRTVAGLSAKGRLEELRTIWQDLANAHLERAGSGVRVDARSLRDQGVQAARPVHHGPAVTAMQRRGIKTRVVALTDARRTLDASHTAVASARRELAQLGLELATAQARDAAVRGRAELATLAREAAVAHSAQLALETRWAAEKQAAQAVETQRAAAAAAELRRLETERAEAATVEARRFETERVRVAAIQARQVAVNEAQKFLNGLSKPRMRLAGFFASTNVNRSLKKSLEATYRNTEALLGPDLIEKLKSWTMTMRSEARAGNESAKQNFEMVTIEWARPLRDETGEFDRGKIERAIVEAKGDGRTDGGPPEGTTKIRPPTPPARAKPKRKDDDRDR